jgi:uncharacterized membrane protein YdjX (TVP38/TMEM64 family)
LSLLALLAVLISGGYLLSRNWLSLDFLTTQEVVLRDYGKRAPLETALVAVGIYIAVTGLSLPGASILTLVYGWYFGFWQGLLIVSFGSTAGATLAFLTTRYIFQDWIQQKFAAQLQSINAAFERDGSYYLFTLRLVPIVPFFVINVVMGLTTVRVLTFWWVSQIGMLPGTAVYVYAGSTIPSLHQLADNGVSNVLTWQLLLAFTLLGIFPLAIKKAIAFANKLTRQQN